MGKLAERLADAKRTGVYRVETADALEEAITLNRFTLARVALGSAATAELGAPCDRLAPLYKWHGKQEKGEIHGTDQRQALY